MSKQLFLIILIIIFFAGSLTFAMEDNIEESPIQECLKCIRSGGDCFRVCLGNQ
ncbi:hypothetical protein DICPUDRAFT_149951 [Dictyostelium purpureum]|uniref:Uncharacterized protein n=1 Tax=Dictyostelium purpureum TaxID=5786 RepID=F0ZF31_DICPU|nr:uncharacterized protein DICPUDRAFT_149951 [Dictyostelium purpureum]EGC37464.1 hypothetical protein DICPUDRAFT_149951 [Dictyostelium purpureum]|eukprot:XP_003286028.1 hypothetical protein DICPUDRAFT_149951 [Dictyostelium purpureum]